MGPYDDYEIYKRTYEWWKEQMLLENTDNDLEPSRFDREPCTSTPSDPLQVYWLKREDGIFEPIPKTDPNDEVPVIINRRGEIRARRRGIVVKDPNVEVPVIAHAWTRRADGSFEPYPENPLIRPRTTTVQSWRDFSGARRLMGVIKKKRRNRIIKFGLPVRLQLIHNPARTYISINLHPLAGFTHLCSRRVRKGFHKQGRRYHTTVALPQLWVPLWNRSAQQWHTAANNADILINSAQSGVTRLRVNYVDPRTSVAWITFDTAAKINWGVVGALRTVVGAHGFQPTVSL